MLYYKSRYRFWNRRLVFLQKRSISKLEMYTASRTGACQNPVTPFPMKRSPCSIARAEVQGKRTATKPVGPSAHIPSPYSKEFKAMRLQKPSPAYIWGSWSGAQKVQQTIFWKCIYVDEVLILRFNLGRSLWVLIWEIGGIYEKEIADNESESGTYPGLFLSMDQKIFW